MSLPSAPAEGLTIWTPHANGRSASGPPENETPVGNLAPSWPLTGPSGGKRIWHSDRRSRSVATHLSRTDILPMDALGLGERTRLQALMALGTSLACFAVQLLYIGRPALVIDEFDGANTPTEGPP
jgi:hypothetical protein